MVVLFMEGKMPKAFYECRWLGVGGDLGESSLRIKKDKPKRLPVDFWGRSQDRHETMNFKNLSKGP